MSPLRGSFGLVCLTTVALAIRQQHGVPIHSVDAAHEKPPAPKGILEEVRLSVLSKLTEPRNSSLCFLESLSFCFCTECILLKAELEPFMAE
ncbi:unnamed protein product [Heligmosomoides polygyrus]|uniref:Secreted protein n=1 Tax=Heligmosomoides polygyrus TaxID=6339 RepID=A0A183FW88_HELPZ|nr:unnamed protein product [Heligmosomoides polygyrus]